MSLRGHHNSTSMLVGMASVLGVCLGLNAYDWGKRCAYCGITEARKGGTGYRHAVRAPKERHLL